MRDFVVSKPTLGDEFLHLSNRSHVLRIHMPHEVIFCHTAPAMRAHEPFLLEGRIIESNYHTHHGETVLDPSEIPNRSAQQRGLGPQEGINGHPLRKDFDEIVDLRDGVIDVGVPFTNEPKELVCRDGRAGGKIYERFVFSTLVPPPFVFRQAFPSAFVPNMFDLRGGS